MRQSPLFCKRSALIALSLMFTLSVVTWLFIFPAGMDDVLKVFPERTNFIFVSHDISDRVGDVVENPSVISFFEKFSSDFSLRTAGEYVRKFAGRNTAAGVIPHFLNQGDAAVIVSSVGARSYLFGPAVSLGLLDGVERRIDSQDREYFLVPKCGSNGESLSVTFSHGILIAVLSYNEEAASFLRYNFEHGAKVPSWMSFLLSPPAADAGAVILPPDQNSDKSRIIKFSVTALNRDVIDVSLSGNAPVLSELAGTRAVGFTNPASLIGNESAVFIEFPTAYLRQLAKDGIIGKLSSPLYHFINAAVDLDKDCYLVFLNTDYAGRYLVKTPVLMLMFPKKNNFSVDDNIASCLDDINRVSRLGLIHQKLNNRQGSCYTIATFRKNLYGALERNDQTAVLEMDEWLVLSSNADALSALSERDLSGISESSVSAATLDAVAGDLSLCADMDETKVLIYDIFALIRLVRHRDGKPLSAGDVAKGEAFVEFVEHLSASGDMNLGLNCSNSEFTLRFLISSQQQ